ncbi:MAG: GlxA family transcriptional regulator [Acidimicrobiales bacterium]|jgi:transcriptional regulator GlxA family with amidase domain
MQQRVVFVVFDGFEILDLTGPMEVFSAASRLQGRPTYTSEVVSTEGGLLSASCGLGIRADRRLAECRGHIDTLVVVGGGGGGAAVADDALVAWVRSAARRSRRLASVCTGAFVLAEAGLLDGRRATTHWSACERLAARLPTATVERDPIFVRDGNVWTSAGVTAGMDLALKLVEDDHGAELARSVARWLVLFVQRPGGQSQFSAQLAAQRPSSLPLRRLEAFVADHLDEDLRVSALARRSAMSPRHFARVFRAEFGETPAAYVEAARVEAARRLLETTTSGTSEIARRCGFGTVETLHRSFRRVLGTTPGQYRHHFASAASA